MKLKQVSIENFRAVKNSTIRLHELTAVVGENNSGKTATLRALNSVFNYEYEENDFINGAHRYSGDISNNKVIRFLFDSSEKKAALEHSIGQSYTQFFDFAKSYGLLPMQYCLEMDLIACKKSRELYFDHYGLEGQQRTYKHLLIDRKQAIKDPTVLLPIVKSMEPKDYPISYKKIRRYLSDQIAGL